MSAEDGPKRFEVLIGDGARDLGNLIAKITA